MKWPATDFTADPGLGSDQFGRRIDLHHAIAAAALGEVKRLVGRRR